MPAWICVRCGVQYPDTLRPPDGCPICADEREAVQEGGQQWTTADELAADHVTELREEEPGLLGVGVEPSFGIGQRALLVRTPHGNVLWDCVSLFDDAARTAIAGWGGVAAICPSHPHFYGACVDVAEAFDARVLLPRADERWIQRPSSRITLFDDEVEPVPGVTVLRVGGHFDGSAVLHWAGGAGWARRPAHRRHDHGRGGPRLGELHVELPQPPPAGRGHGRRDRAAGRAVPLRPRVRRLVGPRGRRRRRRGRAAFGASLRRTAAGVSAAAAARRPRDPTARRQPAPAADRAVLRARPPTSGG